MEEDIKQTVYFSSGLESCFAEYCTKAFRYWRKELNCLERQEYTACA